ncbi:MAG: hypothetical protein ACK5MA_01980 [Parachlamydiaceae bacterium]
MSTPPTGSPPLLRRTATAKHSLKVPHLKHRNPSKQFAHLIAPETTFDSEHRLKHLKTGLVNLRKLYSKDESSPHLQTIIDAIDRLRNTIDSINALPEAVTTVLKDANIPAKDLAVLKTRLLHIDPEEKAHYSMLKNQLEVAQNKVRRKQEIDTLTFLLNSSRSLHDLYLLIHSSYIGTNLKEEIIQMLQAGPHRALDPISLPSPKIDTKPIEEVQRLFWNFESDSMLARVQINGKKYDCRNRSLVESLQTFIERLYGNGWKPLPFEENTVFVQSTDIGFGLPPILDTEKPSSAQLEANEILREKETPVLKLMRAMAFNAQFQTSEHIRTTLKSALEEKLWVKKICNAHLPSIYIQNPNHYSVIHQSTYEAIEKDPNCTPNSNARALPVLIFDVYSVLTFENNVWHEDLHVKNIQILNPKFNLFLERCFSKFQKAKVEVKQQEG